MLNVAANLRGKIILEAKKVLAHQVFKQAIGYIYAKREMIKKLTVAMQYGMLFLHPGHRSSHSGRRNSQKGHGVVASSVSDVSGLL